MLPVLAPTLFLLFHAGASGLPIGPPHQRLVADGNVAADCVGLPPGARGSLQGERCVNSAWNGLKRAATANRNMKRYAYLYGFGRRIQLHDLVLRGRPCELCVACRESEAET